jgi:hypothetical protein
MRLTCALMIGGILTIVGLGISAETSADSNTKMVTIDKTVLEDSLIKGFGDGWKTAKGKWENVDGSIKGSEVKEDMHGAVSRHDANFSDGVVSFNFKLDGAKGISLSLNATKFVGLQSSLQAFRWLKIHKTKKLAIKQWFLLAVTS